MQTWKQVTFWLVLSSLITICSFRWNHPTSHFPFCFITILQQIPLTNLKIHCHYLKEALHDSVGKITKLGLLDITPTLIGLSGEKWWVKGECGAKSANHFMRGWGWPWWWGLARPNLNSDTDKSSNHIRKLRMSKICTLGRINIVSSVYWGEEGCFVIEIFSNTLRRGCIFQQLCWLKE